MMRWLFSLLVVLNVFYYVWSQQQVVLTAKDTGVLERMEQSGKGIRLLSESAAGSVTPAAVDDQVGQDVCLFLGSFDDLKRAQALEQRLLSLDVQSVLEAVEAAGGIDYWVYLAPLASRQASVRQLKELQARKVDSYLIGTGDLANGIS